MKKSEQKAYAKELKELANDYGYSSLGKMLGAHRTTLYGRVQNSESVRFEHVRALRDLQRELAAAQ
jgi:hypothetical protein